MAPYTYLDQTIPVVHMDLHQCEGPCRFVRIGITKFVAFPCAVPCVYPVGLIDIVWLFENTRRNNSIHKERNDRSRKGC